MFIIYRYLLRQFLQIFAICFCSMYGLYIVIDAFTNLEEFLRFGEKRGGGLLFVMGKYYAYRGLSFFDWTSGIVALIAAMFTLALFQRFNELTALQAAGIPKRQIIKPIVLAALAVSLFAAASRELIIPRLSSELALDSHDLGGERAKDLHPKRDASTDILLRGRQTIAKNRQIVEPNFMLSPSLDAPFKQLQAADAFFQPANSEHPSGYLLTGMLQPKDLARRQSLMEDGKPVVLTPHDYRWLKDDECFVASDITFEQLVGTDDWLRYASFLELVAGLRNRSLALGADVAVAIHSRPLQPVLDMTLLFLGLPLLLRRGNRNIFVAIGMCVGLVVAFLLLTMGAGYLGSSYWISPSLAAWLPLMVFVPLAIAISDPLRE
jgi:lipopolysaccharide export system permease protein